MIDIKTGCIIDLLESRDTQDVAKWLKESPNVEVVSRDGSIVFKAAIDVAHPNTKQVNDRFHIIKNLVKSIKKSLQKLIIGRIEIPLTSEATRKRYQYLIGLTRREKIIEAKKLREKGYKGSIAALRGFIAKERRIAKDLLKEREPVELIDKKSIIKLLYKSIDEVKELTEK